MQIPTNSEIRFDESLDDSVLIQVPKTPYAIIGKANKDHSWNVSILTKVGGAKRTIDPKLSRKAFSAIISQTLAPKDQELLKRKHTLTTLKNYYKSLIKEIGQRHSLCQ